MSILLCVDLFFFARAMRHPGYSTLTQSTDDGKATGFLRSPCQITKLPPPPLGEGCQEAPPGWPPLTGASRWPPPPPSTCPATCGDGLRLPLPRPPVVWGTRPPPRPTTTLIFRLPPGPGCRSGGAYLPTPLGRGFTPPPPGACSPWVVGPRPPYTQTWPSCWNWAAGQ